MIGIHVWRVGDDLVVSWWWVHCWLVMDELEVSDGCVVRFWWVSDKCIVGR